MIYVNGKLKERIQDAKHPDFDKDYNELWKQFEDLFSGNLTKIGTINPMKPIVIKYRDGIEVPDKDNEGKFLSPASISLNFTAKGVIGRGQVTIRYAADAPNVDKAGNLNFHMSRTEVFRRMSIMDVDLAFFIWAFSEEMAANGRGIQGKNTNFQIENPELERKEYIRNKAEQNLFEARLFQPVGQGGVNDKMIRYGAKAMGIINADAEQDINKLKIDIERLGKKQELRKIFVEATDTTPSELDEEYVDKRATLADALHHQLIANVTFKSSYFLCEDGKPKTELYNYKEAKKASPKTPTLDLLFLYLEDKHPDMIADFGTRIAAIKEAAAEKQAATA